MLTSSKHVFGQHLLFNGRIGMEEGKYWLSESSENVAFQARFSTFFQEIGRNLVSNFVLPIGKCGGKPQVLTFNDVVTWGGVEEKKKKRSWDIRRSLSRAGLDGGEGGRVTRITQYLIIPRPLSQLENLRATFLVDVGILKIISFTYFARIFRVEQGR